VFSTIDSQPQEWLLNDPNLLHTLALCCFRDSSSARHWIHTLVPKNKNGQFVKWSGGGPRYRAQRRREQFVECLGQHYDEIDFSVHCISSTEGQISEFANALFLQNQQNIQQEFDAKKRNCLVFKITEEKSIRMPALRAAKLIWIYFCMKYMKEVNNLSGFVYSDWFSADTGVGEDKALGVSLVNFLLSSTGTDLQLSIANAPASSEADLLSDWFAGWSNSSKGGAGNLALAAKFEAIIERAPKKIDWVMYQCNLHVTNA
jgi:hypothetical protein